METSKPRLEIAVLAGAESKAWLAGFTQQVDRLEKIAKKLGGAAPAETDADDDAGDDGEEAAPKKSAKKAPAKKAAAKADDDDFNDDAGDDGDAGDSDDFSDDAGGGEGDDDFGDDGDDEPAPKKAPAKKEKAPALKHKDVVAACKEAAGRSNRATVLSMLKKKFKVSSTTDLKAEQYAEAIEELKALKAK